MTRHLVTFSSLVAIVLAVSLHSQTPSLRFVSPTADTYLSGPVLLRVVYDGAGGPGALEDVTFFADGRQVCVVSGAASECAWDAGPEVKEHVLRAVARVRAGGRVVANVRTKTLGVVEAVSVDIVQINAVVTDGGRFIKGLTRQDFRVLDDGQPRPITSFSPAGTPLELVLAIDVSNSMSDVLDDVKKAARTFLGALGPADQVTVVAFNDTMFTLARRETSATARAAAIDRLSASGGTALYDVIVRALEQLGRQPGRRALVLFSDGDDRSSQATFEYVREMVTNSDATLFAVGLGQGARVEDLKKKLESLAEASGGRVMFAERADKLNEPFAEVIQDLSSQYTVAIEPKTDGKYHEVTVQVPGKGYKVRARRGYTITRGTSAPARTP